MRRILGYLLIIVQVYNVGEFCGQCCEILKSSYFCFFIIAICDLIPYVETIFHLHYRLTAFGNILSNMSDARE